MTTAALNKKAEKERGFKEGFQLFELLRDRWPEAFPRKSHEIRPLANSVNQALTEEFGWSPNYARGVLAAWKMRHAYCQAILHYTIRINVDGSTSDEEIGDIARQQAKAQLERHAARQAKKAEKAEQERLRAAAEMKAVTKTPTPEPSPSVIPDDPPMPAAPPKSGKLLVAGSAAMQAALKRRLASGTMTTEIVQAVPAITPNRRRERQSR
jgi:sRNA-binding protein